MSSTTHCDISTLCYSGKLLPLEVGHKITIAGRTQKSAECFDFFLGSDDGSEDELGNIQLHTAINFRGTGEIVRNSHKKNVGWDVNEERFDNLFCADNPNPIKSGDEFKISILAVSEAFLISINEKPYCTFPYRQPLYEAKRINIYGDVETVHEVTQSNPKDAPHECNEFRGSFPTIKEGMALVFRGTPRGVMGQFDVRLTDGSSDKELLVVNSNSNGLKINKDPTGEHEPFPFQIDEYFKMAVGFTHRDFIVTIDGVHVMQLPYEDQSFLGKQITFEIVPKDGLTVDIEGVDLFIMDPNKSVKQIAQPSNEESNKEDDDQDKTPINAGLTIEKGVYS